MRCVSVTLSFALQISEHGATVARAHQQCRCDGLSEGVHQGGLRNALWSQPFGALFADEFAAGHTEADGSQQDCDGVQFGSQVGSNQQG